MVKLYPALMALILCTSNVFAQTATAQQAVDGSTKQPLDKVVGEITQVDSASKKLTVREDSTKTDYAVSIEGTKTFLKVGTDLSIKNATRIEPAQLTAGDRVSIRGRKQDTGSINAASVLVMSANDVQQKRQAELADWKQRGNSGVVAALDPAAKTLSMSVRTPEGQKALAVTLQKTTEFTRYSPDNPKTPAVSQLSDIQSGDQIRVLGNKSDDGSAVVAEKVYSGSFRTVSATLASVSADGKAITITDLQTKQPVQVSLNDESTVRKLPPTMANMMAMRLNPAFKAAAPSGGGKPPSASPDGPPQSANTARDRAPGGLSPDSASASPSGPPRMRGGDLAQMIENLPKINISDLKPGDALVVSGANAGDKSHLVATNIVAGVEPIFQSAPPRSGQSAVNGMWGGLDLSVPGQ